MPRGWLDDRPSPPVRRHAHTGRRCDATDASKQKQVSLCRCGDRARRVDEGYSWDENRRKWRTSTSRHFSASSHASAGRRRTSLQVDLSSTSGDVPFVGLKNPKLSRRRRHRPLLALAANATELLLRSDLDVATLQCVLSRFRRAQKDLSSGRPLVYVGGRALRRPQKSKAFAPPPPPPVARPRSKRH